MQIYSNKVGESEQRGKTDQQVMSPPPFPYKTSFLILKKTPSSLVFLVRKDRWKRIFQGMTKGEISLTKKVGVKIQAWKLHICML